MLGLAYLFLIALYFGLAYLVARFVMRWARRTERSPMWWGWGTGVLFFLLLFGDYFPTLVVHKYYCSILPDVRVYKTADLWATEHANEPRPVPVKDIAITDGQGRRIFRMNDRFGRYFDVQENWLLPIRDSTEVLIDIKTSEVLAARNTVGAGYRTIQYDNSLQRLKFWMDFDSCQPTGATWRQTTDAYRALTVQ